MIIVKLWAQLALVSLFALPAHSTQQEQPQPQPQQQQQQQQQTIISSTVTSVPPLPPPAPPTPSRLTASSPGPNSIPATITLATTSTPAPIYEQNASPISVLAPRSERQPILDVFNKFFMKARSHDDQQQKEYVRDGVINRLRELGFETSFLQKSRFEFRWRPAVSYNMISILPGKYRQTKLDRIVLIGAHWDSATKAPVSCFLIVRVCFF